MIIKNEFSLTGKGWLGCRFSLHKIILELSAMCHMANLLCMRSSPMSVAI